jgi:hypothetical protein
VGRFADLGLLQETTGGRRSRVFRYGPYMSLFIDPDPVLPDDELQVTTP